MVRLETKWQTRRSKKRHPSHDQKMPLGLPVFDRCGVFAVFTGPLSQVLERQ
jgi:hypothetical protein